MPQLSDRLQRAIGGKLIAGGPSKARLLGELTGVTIRSLLGAQVARSLASPATPPTALTFFISEAEQQKGDHAHKFSSRDSQSVARR